MAKTPDPPHPVPGAAMTDKHEPVSQKTVLETPYRAPTRFVCKHDWICAWGPPPPGSWGPQWRCATCMSVARSCGEIDSILGDCGALDNGTALCPFDDAGTP